MRINEEGMREAEQSTPCSQLASFKYSSAISNYIVIGDMAEFCMAFKNISVYDIVISDIPTIKCSNLLSPRVS